MKEKLLYYFCKLNKIKENKAKIKQIFLLLISLIYSFANAQGSDTSLVWAKSFGGSGSDIGTSITTDASGNIYTVGLFNGTVDFNPSTSQIFNITSNGNDDIFITKTDASGNFVWAKRIGGNGFDNANSIATDNNGNIYITGYFSMTVDFDPSATGVFNMTSAMGSDDIFICKLDTNGNFVWAKAMGDEDYDNGFSITTDLAGNIYTTGTFRGTVDFDPSISGVFNLTSSGKSDIFISKMDSAGNFIWAKKIGGAGDDLSSCILIGSTGDILISGGYRETVDFDPSDSGTVNKTSKGGYDIFILKLDSNGAFLWVNTMGSQIDDLAKCIAVNSSGQIYVTGYFNETVDFDPSVSNTANLTAQGSNYGDIFVSKFEMDGSYIWAKKMGNAAEDIGYSLTIDANGNSYISGSFSSTVDFDPSSEGVFNLTSAGLVDIFVSKLDTNGNLVWAKAIGGTTYDVGRSIIVKTDGTIFVTGNFGSTADFDTSASGITNLTSNGNNDVFLLKMNQIGNLSIDDKEIKTDVFFSYYPNPTSDVLTVTGKSEIKEIVVLNLNGQILKTKKPNKVETQIDFSNLAPSIYLVKITMEGKMKIVRIIKK